MLIGLAVIGAIILVVGIVAIMIALEESYLGVWWFGLAVVVVGAVLLGMSGRGALPQENSLGYHLDENTVYEVVAKSELEDGTWAVVVKTPNGKLYARILPVEPPTVFVRVDNNEAPYQLFPRE
ncbi:MAG: hypothetical protein HY457_01340 [Parcubacteria group bacterium]|nr:hypothetical protein [Parcubacteria group bacterium]